MQSVWGELPFTGNSNLKLHRSRFLIGFTECTFFNVKWIKNVKNTVIQHCQGVLGYSATGMLWRKPRNTIHSCQQLHHKEKLLAFSFLFSDHTQKRSEPLELNTRVHKQTNNMKVTLVTIKHLFSHVMPSTALIQDHTFKTFKIKKNKCIIETSWQDRKSTSTWTNKSCFFFWRLLSLGTSVYHVPPYPSTVAATGVVVPLTVPLGGLWHVCAQGPSIS